MSRSALWRQEANVKERERQANETFSRVLEEGQLRSRKGLLRLTNDTHFNLNPMLLQNISKSPYFQKCCNNLKDWSSLVDEIYYEVKSLEPWSNEATRTPSTAFCLLLRLFTMRCSVKEMENMIEHVDSPYIRCIGFLYLRYACDPKELWDWFMPYLYDVEEVKVCEGNKRRGKGQDTVGDFVRSLLDDLEFYGTRLPRLPQGIEREIKMKLIQEEQIEGRAVSHEQNKSRMDYFQKVGNKVIAMYGDEENAVTWYDAVVDRVIWKDDETGFQFARPKFIVTFPEYGNTEKVSLGEMDMPGGTGGGGRGRSRDDAYADNRNRHNDRYHDNYNNNSRGRNYRDRSRSRDRSDFIEEVNRRVCDKVFAKGRSHSSRPASFQHERKRDDFRQYNTNHNNEAKTKSASYSNETKDNLAQNSLKERSAVEVAAIKEKKRKLMAKYG